MIKNSRLNLSELRGDERLNFELGYDSHALLSLLLDIEDEFGIEVPPERVPKLVGVAVADLVAMIESERPSVREGSS
ncbi:MAG: acyl carrier protein [Acidobacteriota bacterium]|nr:MAG: acyl carrier protein [Acidobacteriota bacterium]